MKQLPESEIYYSLLSPEGEYISYGIDYSAYIIILIEDVNIKSKLLDLLLEYG